MKKYRVEILGVLSILKYCNKDTYIIFLLSKLQPERALKNPMCAHILDRLKESGGLFGSFCFPPAERILAKYDGLGFTRTLFE